MQPKVSRRALAKGVAWATPIVAATATVPAYAASHTVPLTVTTCGDQYTPDVSFTKGPLVSSSAQTQLRQSIGTSCYSLPVGTVVTVTTTNAGSSTGTYKASYSTAYTVSGPTSFTDIEPGATATIQFTFGQPVPTGNTMGVFTQYSSGTTYKVTYAFELPSGYTDPAMGKNIATYTISS